MSDLNIRACKALGWKYQPCADDCDKPWHGGFIDNDDDFHFKRDLKFTTSYDWAMLGVKKVIEVDAPSFSCNLYRITKYDWQRDEPDEPNYTSEIEWAMTRWCFSFTPEQITQAWVEVLEATQTDPNH